MCNLVNGLYNSVSLVSFPLWPYRGIPLIYMFQNLRDPVSVGGVHEPVVISSHILQSSFMAEEREHPTNEDWHAWNLSTRTKNVLRRLQEKNVPHAVLNDHKAYSNPRQDVRISFETRRLIRRACDVQTDTWNVPVVVFLCSVLLAVVVFLSKICTEYREIVLYFFAQILRFFSNDQVLAAFLCASYAVIPVLCLSALTLFFVSKAHERTYYSSGLRPYCEGILKCITICALPLWLLITLYTVLGIFSDCNCVSSDVDNSTAITEMTTHSYYTLNVK